MIPKIANNSLTNTASAPHAFHRNVRKLATSRRTAHPPTPPRQNALPKPPTRTIPARCLPARIMALWRQHSNYTRAPSTKAPTIINGNATADHTKNFFIRTSKPDDLPATKLSVDWNVESGSYTFFFFFFLSSRKLPPLQTQKSKQHLKPIFNKPPPLWQQRKWSSPSTSTSKPGKRTSPPITDSCSCPPQ